MRQVLWFKYKVLEIKTAQSNVILITFYYTLMSLINKQDVTFETQVSTSLKHY